MTKVTYLVTSCQGLHTVRTTDEEIRDWFSDIHKDPELNKEMVEDVRILRVPEMTLENYTDLFLY